MCVCLCAFFFLIFFSIFFPTRRMFKLTLVVAEWGRTMGLSHDVCREKQGRAWSAAPGSWRAVVAAHAHRAIGTLF